MDTFEKIMMSMVRDNKIYDYFAQYIDNVNDIKERLILSVMRIMRKSDDLNISFFMSFFNDIYGRDLIGAQIFGDKWWDINYTFELIEYKTDYCSAITMINQYFFV